MSKVKIIRGNGDKSYILTPTAATTLSTTFKMLDVVHKGACSSSKPNDQHWFQMTKRDADRHYFQKDWYTVKELGEPTGVSCPWARGASGPEIKE